MGRLLLSAALAISSASSPSAAIDNVKVLTTFKDGKPASEKMVRLEEQPDGAMRLSIPIRDIKKGTDVIEIHPPFAKARKGEEG